MNVRCRKLRVYVYFDKRGDAYISYLLNTHIIFPRPMSITYYSMYNNNYIHGKKNKGKGAKMGSNYYARST